MFYSHRVGLHHWSSPIFHSRGNAIFEGQILINTNGLLGKLFQFCCYGQWQLKAFKINRLESFEINNLNFCFLNLMTWTSVEDNFSSRPQETDYQRRSIMNPMKKTLKNINCHWINFTLKSIQQIKSHYFQYPSATNLVPHCAEARLTRMGCCCFCWRPRLLRNFLLSVLIIRW